ncbi:MAG TPA: hypothetical protein VH186_26025 [Chloroflexia bacterium]|nr:hypothetical protein [Chloroflexia bacterium]
MLETKPKIVSEIAENKQTQNNFNFRQLLQFSLNTNRILTLLGIMMLISLVASVFGLIFDPRTLGGMPIWTKPAKFSISLALYVFTLIWLLSYVKGHPRLVRLVSWVTFIAFFVEMIIVVTQVIRGVSSHFNVATPLDAALFSLMGNFIMLFWVANLLAAVLLLFQRFDNPAFAWSLRLALILALAGAMLGMLMALQRTPEQQLAIAAGQHLTTAGAHSVGVQDGGPGLPFLGWSTVGGDLRIGHFVGLHALQFLPLLGWLILRFTRTGFTRMHQVILVWVAGAGYAGLIALFTWQALRGQSIIAPDALTLAGFGALVVATCLGAGGVGLHARTRKSRLAVSQS